jgi:hypothetical protein
MRTPTTDRRTSTTTRTSSSSMPDSTDTPMAFTVDRETPSGRRFRVATLVAHLVAFLLAATLGLFADPALFVAPPETHAPPVAPFQGHPPVAPSHVPATHQVA